MDEQFSLHPARSLTVGDHLGRVLSTGAKFARHQPLGAISVVWLVATIGVAFLAPLLAPYVPTSLVGPKYLPPSEQFPLGTDHLGRDVLSRVIWGTRPSVFVGILSVSLAVAVGSLWGIASGYIGGLFDMLSQRLVDILGAFPGIILALTLMAIFGASVTNVAIAIMVTFVAGNTRTMRSASLAVKNQPYIEAARVIGCSQARVLLRHIAPNCATVGIILFSIGVGGGILAEASLSFLGAGIPPEVPSWGGMLNRAVQDFWTASPWAVIVPGVAISVTVLAFNLLGDSLRDTLDPKLRGR